MQHRYPQLGETQFQTVLPNGLRVLVVPRRGFSRKLAYFVTDFGSIHRDFLLEGKEYHAPAGVAHFLEHKLFELPGRDVTAEFAELGGSVNAFTSYDLTAYYFTCSDRFAENLRLLLEFVSTPYFTRESVTREQGIIDQEIGMCEDSPDNRDFELLMEQMYVNHPIRVPILGSRESIRKITSQVLEDCHRAFYTPANMVLCVIGDVDEKEVVTIANEVLGTERKAPAVKLKNWEEKPVCPVAHGQLSMEVAMPSFRLGFKCEPTATGTDAAILDVVGYLAAEVLLGESSALYLDLYQKGLIDTSFGAGFETVDGCAMLTCGGDSEDAQAVRRAILDRAAEIAREGIDETEFLRLKRGALGRRIRELDSFDSTCFRLCAYHFLGFDYFDFPGIYESVTKEQVQELLTQVVTEERCSMVVTLPLN